MTQTIDANILLYASDATSPRRARASALIEDLVAGPGIVYLFWPTLMAYLRLSTHSGVFRDPLGIEDAVSNVAHLLDHPRVRHGSMDRTFWSGFQAVVADARPIGNLISDAWVVALMRANGVRTIWTHDRAFRRFSGIEVRDPFDGDS